MALGEKESIQMRIGRQEDQDHPAVLIRKYRPSDHGHCRDLWAELTMWHRGIYDDGTIGGTDPGRHFDSHLREHGPRSILIAEMNGQIVGMAGLINNNGDYELEPLIVRKKYRGQGIGRMLTQAVINAARNEGANLLNVKPVARNDPAIRFFHELGFDTLGHIQMFIDFSAADRQKWKGKKRLAGKDFRY